MKTVVLLSIGLTGFLQGSAWAAVRPSGTVLELHSCELYAGGCIVSSQATQGGRYMLRVWTFAGGDYAGASLAGLQAALLQVSEDNLAAPESVSTGGVLYLPKTASAGQQRALREWVETAATSPGARRLETRIVPMQLTRETNHYRFTAGEFLSLATGPRPPCTAVSCGETLWYAPRTDGTLFTVAQDQASRISEPLLKLKWQDSGKNNVFLVKFGGDAPAKNLYVSSAEVCAPGAGVF